MASVGSGGVGDGEDLSSASHLARREGDQPSSSEQSQLEGVKGTGEDGQEGRGSTRPRTPYFA